MPDRPNNIDSRIDALAGEVDRLRHGRERADGHLQQVLLKVTEVQLNLASQDKLLARLECTINGGEDGKPGLATRVDRFERNGRQFGAVRVDRHRHAGHGGGGPGAAVVEVRPPLRAEFK